MKIKLFSTTAAIALIGLVCTSSLLAADELTNQRPSREEMMKRFDVNNDGKLDQSERTTMRAAAADRPSGQRGERTERGGRGERGERAERGGRGGPGGERGAGGPAGRGGPGGPDRMAQFDQDGDGKLNETERAAAGTAMRANMASNPRAMARVDTDGDGKVSDAEWTVAQKVLGHQRGPRGPGGPGGGGKGKGKEQSN